MLNLTRSTWGRYLIAVLTVTASVLSTFTLWPFNQPIRLAFFYAAVVVSTIYGGLRAGFLAIALSVVASGYFFFAPFNSPVIRATAFIQLTVFVAVTLLIAFMIERGKRAESRLAVSERRFRQLADNIDQVFWVYDLNEARVVYANPAYKTTWGETRENLYQDESAFFAILHPDDRTRVTDALRRP
jgi:PAS domain-containing protein